MNKPTGDYEAEFTSEQNMPVQCNRCKQQFAPGTRLQWMHNKHQGEGCYLCGSCYEYYLSKKTTIRRDNNQGHKSEIAARNVKALPVASAAAHVGRDNAATSEAAVVQKHIAAAQRDERLAPVVAVGRNITQSVAYGSPVTNRPARQQGVSSFGALSGPGSTVVNVGLKAKSLTFPQKDLLNPGYQEAHGFYNEMRQHFAAMAYSSVANAELVVVKVWLSVRVPTKKSPVHIAGLHEAVSNIPVHIGLTDLKRVMYYALLPQFLEWSKGFPLRINDCVVRNKLWVELIPKQPDVDAISEHFFSFKGRNKLSKIFTPKQGIELYLCITHRLYESIIDHITEPKETSHRRNDEMQVSILLASLHGSIASKAVKRKYWESDNFEADPVEGPSLQHTADELKNALQLQVPPRKKNMKSLFQTVIEDVSFFKLPPPVSFSDLVKNPDELQNPQHFAPMNATISYDPSAIPFKGAFKLARVGYTSTPFLGSRLSNTCICIKQIFGGIDPVTDKPIVYEGQTQAKKVSIELNCLGWASALMELVYQKKRTRGVPPFTIPVMRYVNSGLAISKTNNANVYLLEEYIESKSPTGDAWFVKYLNNSSAHPVYFANPEQNEWSQFLSFAQHIQYIETKGLAFVSDFQGTSIPGLIFGDGNTKFETFALEHDCNKFCQFFGLPKIDRPRINLADIPPLVESDSLPSQIRRQKSDSGSADMELSED
ncbi:hypothetical protein JR316_0010715 [Psilocybe cubensis]|uniref:Uncharacterized protein n=1 Tax=Psilocybe cubensis TaxID=181762 RepID=A0ACB8GM09_PSICU|nr:hypothetical protein JR316_0010715 [Psilocybe cubensis]KAH9476800.1 hypothetical protein JR316_0010715 [Psilocybe cubensis]